MKRADAEDAHHEGWLKVVKALRDKPVEGNYRGWVFQVMRNAAYDAMRRKRPTPAEGELIEAAAGADPELTAPSAMIQQEYRDALAACLGELDPLHQGLLRGRLAGRDYTELAEELGVAVARAHRVLHSAKTAVTRCVQGRMGGTL
ncbi:MAG: sigma-70 family RNA polymerase sigma factor [Planctomycetota bacterium]